MNNREQIEQAANEFCKKYHNPYEQCAASEGFIACAEILQPEIDKLQESVKHYQDNFNSMVSKHNELIDYLQKNLILDGFCK